MTLGIAHDCMQMSLPKNKFRAAQLDSLLLDDEIQSILKQWIESFLSITDESLIYKSQRAIKAAVSLLSLAIPILFQRQTLGMNIQGLTFAAGKLKIVLFLSVEFLLGMIDESPIVLRSLELLDLLKIMNFVRFLRSGRYPTILHRFLRMEIKPVSGREDSQQSIDFEYMNRQLLWQALTETCLVVVPVLRSYVGATMSWLQLRPRNRLALPAEELRGEEGSCFICHHPRPAMPQKMHKCSHAFCYYCLAKCRLLSGGRRNACPVCTVTQSL